MVTLKFYSDFKESLDAEDDAMATEPHLLRRTDITELGDAFIKAEKLQEL